METERGLANHLPVLLQIEQAPDLILTWRSESARTPAPIAQSASCW